MPRTPAVVLSAVTLVAAFGLAGCGAGGNPATPSSPRSALARPAAPATLPLPAPEVLTGVLYRLADTSVPAEQKVGLVQYATVDDQPALANFGEALHANGFEPLTIAATDLAWGGDPGHVTANVTMGSPDPRVTPFVYPMEFAPLRDGWQLSSRTADQILPLLSAAPPR